MPASDTKGKAGMKITDAVSVEIRDGCCLRGKLTVGSG